MEKETAYVNSVLNAMQIINLFATEGTSLGITDVSKKLGIHKATAFKIMRTLKSENWLMQDPKSSCYYFGIGMLPIAHAVERSFDLHDVLTQMMHELSSAFQEDVVLCKISTGGALCVIKIESNHSLVTSAKEGGLLPLHFGATGKSLLAYQTHDVIANSYENNKHELRQSQSIFFDEMRAIRRQGYAITSGDYDSGIDAVAVPIFDRDGNVQYSLSIAGPTERLERIGLDAIRLALQQTVKKMEKILNAEKNLKDN